MEAQELKPRSFETARGTAGVVAEELFREVDVILSGEKPSFILLDSRRGWKPRPFKTEPQAELFGSL
jgi:hypothetical protein